MCLIKVGDLTKANKKRKKSSSLSVKECTKVINHLLKNTPLGNSLKMLSKYGN